MTVRIGITGPIGCGKSTVARLLEQRGAVVIDADAAARSVTETGSPTQAAVIEAFGEAVRGRDGSLDRAALAGIVFRDPVALARLEEIVHPAVRPLIVAALEQAAGRGAPAVVVEAIKLVEGGLADLCDEVWLVTCSPGEQRARLLTRGSAPADADARIASQGAIRERLGPRATRTIDTGGSLTATRRRVGVAYRAALERAAAPGA